MKSRKLWLIPCAFFLAACAVNLYGCLLHNVTVERYVKGALMPLLAVTAMAYLAQRPFHRRVAGTLLLAQMLGWAGDSLLMGEGFVWFASGIGCFLLGHIGYISIFSRAVKGLRPITWVITTIVMAGLLVALVLGIGISGALLVPMVIYGAALLVITFCGLCGLVRGQGPLSAVWWMVTLGGLLFVISDGLIAMRTFGLAHFGLRGFVIMSTYLVAQSLICAAAARIALVKK